MPTNHIGSQRMGCCSPKALLGRHAVELLGVLYVWGKKGVVSELQAGKCGWEE
jgi:hypothetical protein